MLETPHKTAVLLSLKPQYWQLYLEREKSMEIRKSYPDLQTPFDIFVYETKTKSSGYGPGRGRVVGKLHCVEILESIYGENYEWFCAAGCLSQEEIYKYAGGKPLYGWAVGIAEVYDEPQTLEEMFGMKRPPQSWQYVLANR